MLRLHGDLVTVPPTGTWRAVRRPTGRGKVLVLAPVAVALALAVSGCAGDQSASPVGVNGVLASDIYLAADTTRILGVVPRNSTLASMLRAEGLAEEAAHQAVAAAVTVFDPRRLRSDQPFILERTFEGALRLFEYEVDADSLLRVEAGTTDEVGVSAELVPIPKTLEHGSTAGVIGQETPSLFQAMGASGEGPELALALAGIFAGEIDFNTELQLNDRFSLAFERWTREGRPSSYGAITAAEFQNDGRLVSAVRFTPEGAETGYFDEEGRSLRRFFLRSPLKFDPRVTSRFSRARRHPVLNVTRAHRGVDYGAPTGAPVVAVSSGVVVSATYDNTNGRMVRLRHASGYETYYLHLSAFAQGVRRGARIEQGQTIGRVGATGLATGPHLHYGLKKNGAWVDPVREHRNMPPGDPVPADQMIAFELERDQALAQLEGASRNIATH